MAVDNRSVIVPAYMHFEDFLDKHEHDQLLAFVQENRDRLAPSTVNEPGTDAIARDEEFRRSHTLFDLDEVWPFFEQRLVALLPHARIELHLPRFELDHIERQLTTHGDGDFFARHADNGGIGGATRVLTFVYYFYPQPKRFEGGELRLYDAIEGDDGLVHTADTFQLVEPADNSVVLFASGVQHEVMAVRTDAGFEGRRFSVNGWFRERRD